MHPVILNLLVLNLFQYFRISNPTNDLYLPRLEAETSSA